MLRGQRAGGESDGAERSRKAVSVSFHSEHRALFSGLISQAIISLETRVLSNTATQHIVLIHDYISLFLNSFFRVLFFINSSFRSTSAIALLQVLSKQIFQLCSFIMHELCQNYKLHSLVKRMTGRFELYDFEEFMHLFLFPLSSHILTL